MKQLAQRKLYPEKVTEGQLRKKSWPMLRWLLIEHDRSDPSDSFSLLRVELMRNQWQQRGSLSGQGRLDL